MGARIESVAARRARSGPLAQGALQLSDTVARMCLDRARRRADELDLLVNAGLYKEKHVAEPALAALIQEDIGANPGHPPRPDRHGTFSFDVMNGGCGALSALFLVDGFVAAGTARLGLVVAADTDPEPRISHDFPFPPVGAAALLAHTTGDEGFARFAFKTFAEDAELFEARVVYEPRGELFGLRGHPALQLREHPHFAARCVEHAVAATREFLDEAELAVPDIDVLVSSAYPLRFARALAQAIGVTAERVPELPAELAGAHTAGPLASLAVAMESRRFARARNVLFVTVGAGITVGIAHYRKAG